jgi:hypothetical protein
MEARSLRALKKLLSQQDGPRTEGLAELVRQAGETRTGITRISQGINPDAITKTAAGAAILTENANERDGSGVRAETCLKPVFKAIAHLIKKYQNTKRMIRIYNKFVEMDPGIWSDVSPQMAPWSYSRSVDGLRLGIQAVHCGGWGFSVGHILLS